MPSTVNNLEVLFEDNHIIAVNKKPSDIVQGDKTGDTPLSDIVKAYLKNKYNKPGNVYLGTVHRIDRPVSGVVIFAKTSKALSRLNKAFQEKKVQKTYWAVVESKPLKIEGGELTNYLLKNQEKNRSVAYSKPYKKAKESTLSFQIEGKSDHYLFVEVKPKTGRHHQIRVQLSFNGSPIKGDVKYGARRGNKDASIHLHARKIELMHPVSKEKLEIISNPPEDVLWKEFLKLK